MNNLHGDHYGFGVENNNPTSSLTNAPKGKSVSTLPNSNGGIMGSGIATSSLDRDFIDNDNAGEMNQHNVFARAQAANGSYSNEKFEEDREKNHLRIVLVVGISLLLLIIVAVACVLFLN